MLDLSFADVLAAIGVVLNGLPQGLLALTYGFAAFPTALAFGVGALGAAVVGSVAPISFQAETIVMAGTMGKERRERLSIVLWTGAVMAVVGLLGLLTPATEFVGDTILTAMMAGVGLILARVAMNMIKDSKIVGGVSLAAAMLVYLFSQDLVYTIVISVVAGSLAGYWRQSGRKVQIDAPNEKLELQRPFWNSRIVRGTLALVTLQVGGNIAYATITGDIAERAVNVDHVTVYSGIASALSALFGGGPVEAIISGTGAAPNPVASGVLMMILMAVLLALKLLPKVAAYVPSQSIAGFLFVLGALVVLPANMELALQGNPMVVGTTTVVTLGTDPFLGMVAGVAVRAFLTLIGGM